MVKSVKVILILVGISTLLWGCSTPADEVQVIPAIEPEPTEASASMPDPTEPPEVAPTEKPPAAAPAVDDALPKRSGAQTKTSGTVPHVQIGVEPVAAVNEELIRRAFLLPGVEERPTIVSLPGAQGMWLGDDVPVVNPQVIVNGREFAHIHPDGSLHAPLPFERAMEVTEKGWGERHPWATDRDGWDGFVMLYTPLTMEELEVTFQLIVESYNHVTGETVQASDFQ